MFPFYCFLLIKYTNSIGDNQPKELSSIHRSERKCMKENEKRAWAELEESWNMVGRDRTHGASELLKSALHAFLQFIESYESPDYGAIDSLMNDLANLRTDMAVFSNCVRLINTESVDSLANSVIQLLEYLEHAPEKIAGNAGKTISKPVTIMTNSRSSVVERVILYLHDTSKLKQVIQAESRPAYEGRKNAERLLDSGVYVTVIPDAAMGYWINYADTVIVGADAVAVDGSFLGKIGCYPLALLARNAGIGYYIAAERLKFIHDLPNELEANQKFSGDAIGWGVMSDRLLLSNIIFEITPGKLVTGYITDFGLQKPPLTVFETL